MPSLHAYCKSYNNERIKGVRESRRKMKGERWTMRGEKEGERKRE